MAAQVAEVIHEPTSIKLSAIVENHGSRDAESGNDVPLDKPAHLCCGNGRDGLIFDLLGEVVHDHKKVLALACSSREGAKNVHAPGGKWEWDDYRCHIGGGDLLDGRELLTLVTSLRQHHCVFPQARPVVADLDSHYG